MAMRSALGALRGKQDFSAFCAAPGRGRTPTCTVRSVRLIERGDQLVVLLSADSFLHHMVRNIVGSLVEVGRGARPPGWMAELLAGRDRTRAGPTAPAQGSISRAGALRRRCSWLRKPAGPRDRGFKARKREDHALVLIEELKENLGDVVKTRRILKELGRYYDPVLGGAIMELSHRRAIVEAAEAGKVAERAGSGRGALPPLYKG